MSVVNQIKHYQRSIEKCADDESKVLHCIEKLYKLAVTVQHLQDTGVGRTVNALRKYDGAVGDAAKALVAKWKTMVVDEESSECDDEDDTANQDPPEGYSDNSDSGLDKDAAPKKPSRNHSPREKENRNTSRHESRHSKSREQTMDSEPRAGDRSKSSSKRDEKRRETSSSSSSTKQTDSSSRKSVADQVASNGHDKKEKKRKHSVTGVDSEKRRKHSETPEQSADNGDDNDGDKSSDCDKVKKTKTSTSKEPEKREKSSKEKHKHHHSSGSSSSSKSLKSEKSDGDKKNSHHDDTRESSKSSRHSSRDKKSSSKDRHKKSSSSSSTRDEKKKEKRKFNNGDDGGIDCNSGASFAEALGMCAAPPSSKKSKIMSPPVKPETKERKTKEIKTEEQEEEQPLSLLAPNVKLPPLVSSIDLAATLPETNPNYKPLPNNYMYMMNKKEEENKAMSEVIYTKNMRTKVYSGNKTGYTSVPSLYEICIRVLIENIEALEVTGGVPFDIIKPVLERATPDQLFMLEHYNPYLIEDTDALWKFHCTKEFRNKEREEMETWREMYMRCLDEREAKLKALTANINKSKIEKSLPVRSTKMAYVDNIVKPPRNVLRKQARYGTASSSETASDMKKKLLIAGATSATNISVPSPPMSRMKSSSSSAVVKKNKAPLMAKALQLIKGRYKR